MRTLLKYRSIFFGLVLGLAVAGCRDRHAASPAPVSPRTAPAAAAVSPAPRGDALAACVTSHGLRLHAAAATNMQPPFIRRTDPLAAGGVCLEVPPGAGHAEGTISLPFAVETTGPYTVWIRAFWGSDGEDACSNSLHLQIDGLPRILVQDATYRVWHWVRARFPASREGWVQIAAGAHRLQLGSREDGIKVDQIYCVPWHPNEMACYVPQDIEN
jgi:hypothetical protein